MRRSSCRIRSSSSSFSYSYSISTHWFVARTRTRTRTIKREKGSALIVALWVIVLLSLLVASFAFDMKVELEITSFYRNRLKAQYVAQGGMELAKVIIKQSTKVDEALEEEFFHEDEQIALGAVNLSRGTAMRNLKREIGEGTLTLTIEPEEGRRNINLLVDDYDDWEEILDQAGVPQELWPELIHTFWDFIEPGDTRRLHGAEPDDPWYTRRGYEAKGAELDTIDELLLVKGFTEEIVYGSPPGTPADESMRGIASWLTTWTTDNRVNVNTASREVLLTISGIDEFVVDAIIEHRVGLDGIAGTREDGFESVDEVIALTGMRADLRDRIRVRDVDFYRITSIGEVRGVRRGAWAVMRVENGDVTPVFWREEQL